MGSKGKNFQGADEKISGIWGDQRSILREHYGVPEGSKSTEVVHHSMYAYIDIHVHV